MNNICGDKPLNSGSRPQHIDTTQCTQKLHICATTHEHKHVSSNSPKTHQGSKRGLRGWAGGKGIVNEDITWSKRSRWRQLKENNKREEANTALMKVCGNVCLLAAWGFETLGNPSGRWAVKNSTTSSCCCLPTFLFYSLSFQNLTLLLRAYFIIQQWHVNKYEEKMLNCL